MQNNVHVSSTNGVCTITIDVIGRSVNVLNEAVVSELESAISKIENDDTIKAVILRSGKPNTFIAGADIHQLNSASESDLKMIIERGNKLMNRIESLKSKIVTVAAINGVCLGGGLELALAFDYRVASKSAKVGLPEVKLGLIPGWGGTQRLPKLVGVIKGLEMIMRGETVSALRALSYGLIDVVVDDHMIDVAPMNFIERCFKVGRPHHKDRRSFKTKILEMTKLGKRFICNKAKKKAIKDSYTLYPALPAAVDAIKAGVVGGDGFKVEAGEFVKLAVGDVSKNLRRVYFLSENAKKSASGSKFKSVGILGAGTMGCGIATVSSLSSNVVLCDADAMLSKALIKIKASIDNDVRRKNIDDVQARNRYNRIVPIDFSNDLSAFSDCDLVIEAVPEDMAIKSSLFDKLGKCVSHDCIIATNTSALDIDVLATNVPHPERFVGIHFFNPVEKMQLVEIIRGKCTSDETIARALAYVKQIGKLPVVVKNSPGFLVNRILMPYLVAAANILSNYRNEISDIDDAAKKFGMPMGPLELLDVIGIDVAVDVTKTFAAAFGNRFNNLANSSTIFNSMGAPTILHGMVGAGCLGKKSGKGFYIYNGDKKIVNDVIVDILNDRGKLSKPYHDSVQAALVNAMVDEARMVLSEGVCNSEDDIDLAMVFGTGFAPCKGGLMHYIKQIS